MNAQIKWISNMYSNWKSYPKDLCHLVSKQKQII